MSNSQKINNSSIPINNIVDDIVDDIVIALLVKDKGHCLSYYLKYILHQTWPKNHTILYIKTNDNNDDTIKILDEWVTTYSSNYKSIYYNKESVDKKLLKYAPHEWNSLRFKILGKIRQESIDYAIASNAHYFVADCDNFICPHTIMNLYLSDCHVIGPMLTSKSAYSNYHNICDTTGYFVENADYYKILSKEINGTIPVDVIHCTYFIRNEILPKISYIDDSSDYEYVIFSRTLRNNNIQQYLLNDVHYGWITFADTKQQLETDPVFLHINELMNSFDKIDCV